MTDVDRYGTPGGTLVIALHGAVGNRKLWLPLARVLPPAVELWCFDLPGHGARRDVPFTIAASLDRIDALLAEASPRRAILAGDSLGGYLALVAAARRDPRIAGVVAGGCTWSMTGWRGALARASDLPVRALEAIFGDAALERFASDGMPRLVDADTAREIASVGFRMRARSESLAELAGTDVVALARAIETPIAFVNGAFDWPTRAGEGELLRCNPRATLTIGRGGHGVGFFAPSAFADAIADAVRRSR